LLIDAETSRVQRYLPDERHVSAHNRHALAENQEFCGNILGSVLSSVGESSEEHEGHDSHFHKKMVEIASRTKEQDDAFKECLTHIKGRQNGPERSQQQNKATNVS